MSYEDYQIGVSSGRRKCEDATRRRVGWRYAGWTLAVINTLTAPPRSLPHGSSPYRQTVQSPPHSG